MSKEKKFIYLLCQGIEPVGDVGASCASNRSAKFALVFVIVMKQFGQIINAIEEGDPAVAVSVVTTHFARCVESTQLVRLGNI